MSAPSSRRMIAAGAATVAIFLVIQLVALALVEPFVSAGFQAVEDPSDPTNTLAYFVAILVATGVILLILRFDIGWLLKAIVAVMSGMLSLYVLVILVPRVVEIGGFNALAWGLAGLLAIALYVYPEWYVVDTAGILMGAGGAGLFGISFGPLPAVLLLSVLAVYDAISVYRTEHMLTLAAGVTDLKLPLVLVIPLTWGYSFIEDTPAVDVEAEETTGEPDRTSAVAADQTDSGTPTTDPEAMDRDAFFVGLGDAVLPSVMVASAATFSTAPPVALGLLALNLPALGAMVGTIAGLVVLLWLVAKGRPHAGLPLLNGGAIGGYLVGALASGIGPLTALGVTPYL